MPASQFKPLHREATGQVALWQKGDRYFELLARRFGPRFVDYRRRWLETSARGDSGDFPLSLDLAINSGCQLSCLMCPLPSRPEARRVNLMPAALFEDLMNQGRDHRLAALTIGLGSEPLLNPSAAAWIQLAERAGVMDIRLGTNGLALTPDLSRALIDSGLTRLEISLDAARPETYKIIRGGSLDRLTRAIDDFLEARQKTGSDFPLLRLSFLKLPQNEGELDLFLARWGEAADLVSIQEPIWFPGSRLPEPDGPARPLAPLCAQSWQRLGVNYDGRIWPCCSWYGEKILPFNAADSPLARVWSSSEMKTLRQSLAEGSNPPPACAACRY